VQGPSSLRDAQGAASTLSQAGTETRGHEWPGASSSHAFLQKTLPRSKHFRVRAEFPGGREPLVGPAVRPARQGDGPSNQAHGGAWLQESHSGVPMAPLPGRAPKHPPLSQAVSQVLYESPRAGSVASVSLGRAATLLVSWLLGSGPGACGMTAGRTQNNAYQESALGELSSSHTWLGIAQRIPRDTTGEETPLPVPLPVASRSSLATLRGRRRHRCQHQQSCRNRSESGTAAGSSSAAPSTAAGSDSG